MAVPKRRTSKSKRDMRRAQNSKLSAPHLVACPQCNELKPTHKVCLNCGYYKEREVVKVKVKAN